MEGGVVVVEGEGEEGGGVRSNVVGGGFVVGGLWVGWGV